MGMKNDKKARTALARVDNKRYRNLVQVAREAIYRRNYYVQSTAIERMLKPQSLVPTLVSYQRSSTCFTTGPNLWQNAFSDRLSQFGLNFFSLFVVDLMHEVELGVWKALLIHLLRILQAVDEKTLHELDQR